MSFLKLNGSVCIVLVALAIVMANARIALADTKTLVCSSGNFQATVDLNEAQGTATYNIAASTNSLGIFAPAYSTGPLPAKFDSKTVTFDLNKENPNGSYMGYNHYTIDRVTGLFSIYSSLNVPWDQAAPKDRFMNQYNCHAGTAQF